MAFVTTLATDVGIIMDPTWEHIECEIRALDAQVHTIVTLAPGPPMGAPDGEHHLAIGGGNGRFIVYMTEDNLKFWNLVEPERQKDQTVVRMSVGGQDGDYRACQLVSLDSAIRAALGYFETGERVTDRGERVTELVWRTK